MSLLSISLYQPTIQPKIENLSLQNLGFQLLIHGEGVILAENLHAAFVIM